MNDMNNTLATPSAGGAQCPRCCAPAGHPCKTGCPEAGLASAMRKAIDMLAQVDVSKVPLAVPAALGVLRCAIDVEPGPQVASCQQAKPTPMILHCPKCHLQHIDAPDQRKVPAFGPGMDVEPWTNPPHRSHLCHGCGHIWRPADVSTEGVAAIQTRGSNDSAVPPAKPISSRAEWRNSARHLWLRDKSEPGLCAFYLSVGKALDGVKFRPETVDAAIDAQIFEQQSMEGGA